MPGDILSLRALNRATLARQMLLRRAELPALDAVAHLVGMQAQIPLNPYLGLWSRLSGFRPGELSRLLVDRRVVRIVALRGTLHLLTADDCLALRPLAQPVLDQELARHPEHAPGLRGRDLVPVLEFARALLAEPRSLPELRAALAARFSDAAPASLAFACRNNLALVQVPPRGVWGESAEIRLATAESWLGQPLTERPSIDTVVVRYLAAFGPATAADVTTWARLPGMREVLERRRPGLRTFRDPSGRELFDVPDAPLPDPDTPAPPRFLPEYDNVLLSHADRSRFVSDEHRRRLSAQERPVRGSVLNDGTLVGRWSIDDAAAAPTLVVATVSPLPKRTAATVAAEGRRAMRFLRSDDGWDVRFIPA